MMSSADQGFQIALYYVHFFCRGEAGLGDTHRLICPFPPGFGPPSGVLPESLVIVNVMLEGSSVRANSLPDRFFGL